MNWQPIETAPINTPILIAFYDAWQGNEYFDGESRWYVWPGIKNLPPRKRKPQWIGISDEPLDCITDMKYWMPFPDPPEFPEFPEFLE